MTPEFHRFDFWIGTWDVFETGGTTTVAYLLVDSVLDSTWVTNRRELLVIEGHFLNLGGLGPPLLF